MDFGKAFTFVFDDIDWLKKVFINALLGLIPLVGQLYLIGWGLEIARRVAMGEPTSLPDADFGTYLGHGWKSLVVSLVYTIPIWVLMIPVIVVGIITETAGMDGDVAGAIMGAVGLVVGLLSMVYGIAMGLLLPAAMTRAVLFGSIGDGLQVGEVLNLVKAAPGAYLLTLVGTMVAGMAAGLVGSIACGVGVFFTMAIAQAITGHFYGQAYRQAAAAG